MFYSLAFFSVRHILEKTLSSFEEACCEVLCLFLWVSLSFDRKTGGFQTEVLVVREVSIGFVEVMNPSQPKKREVRPPTRQAKVKLLKFLGRNFTFAFCCSLLK